MKWLSNLFGYDNYPNSFKDQWITWNIWDGELSVSFDLRQEEQVKLLSLIHPRFLGCPQYKTLKVVNEKNFYNERQIKIGLKNLLDKKGNIVKDSLGKAIQVDNFKTVSARIYEYQQYKACQVIANVVFTNLQNNQLIQSFPLNSESIFDNVYATFKGDRRAIDLNYNDYFDRRPMPFPSNEQMVFDTGEDLKNKFKSILKNNRM